MSPAELAAIEARANAATPEPWTRWPEDEDGGSGWAIVSDADGEPVVGAAPCPLEQCADAEADYAFIAAARSDVPALITEVRRLQSENAEYARLVDEWRALALMREEAHTGGYREGRSLADIEIADLKQRLQDEYEGRNKALRERNDALRKLGVIKP